MYPTVPHRMPGVTADTNVTPRHIVVDNPVLKRAGIIIDGSKSYDAGSTPAWELRAGHLLGKITASGKYAPSIIGLTGEAIDSAETEITVAAGVVTELLRRVGATGTFKITGPPSAGGTVRTLTATYSAASGTTITITALGADDVQTLTLSAGTDGGYFSVSYKGQTTAPQAYNVSAANLQVALRALHADLAAVTVDLTSEVYTVTNPAASVPVGGMEDLIVVADTTADSGVFEGGITSAHGTAGVNGEFVTSSLIQPTDGSETPRGLFPGDDGYAVRVVDDDFTTALDLSWAKFIVGCDMMSPADVILNWPADASLRAWVKAQLRAYSPRWGFTDDYE